MPRARFIALLGGHRRRLALAAPAAGCGRRWRRPPPRSRAVETYPLSKVRRGPDRLRAHHLAGHDARALRVRGHRRDPKNFLPKMDIILVKSEDKKLEVTGFWQGMSGSPLFIDGQARLRVLLRLPLQQGRDRRLHADRVHEARGLQGPAPPHRGVQPAAANRAGAARRAAAPMLARAATTPSEWRELAPGGKVGAAMAASARRGSRGCSARRCRARRPTGRRSAASRAR